MRLILVRHGETNYNVKKIIQGQSDSKLTKRGREQAKRLGKRLKREKIDKAYVSDLGRAVETAKEIMKSHEGIPIMHDPLVREANLGIFQDKPSKFLHDSVKESGLPYHKFKPEGGESIPVLRRRAIRFFKSIYPKEKGKTVLVISHSGFLRRLLLYLLNESEEKNEKFYLPNGAITIIEIKDNSKHRLIKLNSVDHL